MNKYPVHFGDYKTDWWITIWAQTRAMAMVEAKARVARNYRKGWYLIEVADGTNSNRISGGNGDRAATVLAKSLGMHELTLKALEDIDAR